MTFTGATTFQYALTTSGDISLHPGAPRGVSPIFSLSDVVLFLAIASSISALLALLMRTKLGALLLAMSADGEFVRFRHHRRTEVIVLTEAIGNGIVALAGVFSARTLVPQTSALTRSSFSSASEPFSPEMQ